MAEAKDRLGPNITILKPLPMRGPFVDTAEGRAEAEEDIGRAFRGVAPGDNVIYQFVGSRMAQRFFIVDSETGEVTRHALTTEAYTDEQYREALVQAGFMDIRFFPSLVGVDVTDESQSVNLAMIARKEPNQAFEAMS